LSNSPILSGVTPSYAGSTKTGLLAIVNFLDPGCLFCCSTKSVEALTTMTQIYKMKLLLQISKIVINKNYRNPQHFVVIIDIHEGLCTNNAKKSEKENKTCKL